jgi:hypothetical protein
MLCLPAFGNGDAEDSMFLDLFLGSRFGFSALVGSLIAAVHSDCIAIKQGT